MNQPLQANISLDLLASPAWYKATTLLERVALLRQCPSVSSEVDTNRADRLLQEWKSKTLFDKEEFSFADRLKVGGITEEELYNALGISDEALQQKFDIPPAWLQYLIHAFKADPISKVEVKASAQDDTPWIEFVHVAEPLIQAGLKDFHLQVAELLKNPSPIDPESVERLFYPQLLNRLYALLPRTMVLELNVARLQEVLSGATAEERFASFIERLKDREVSATLLQEYPVLARQLVTRVWQWVETSSEFIKHLLNDWADIYPLFGLPSDDVLIQLSGGMGDSHRGGRTVSVAIFKSGKRLVYKPRSLSVDVHFQQLLDWLNKRGCEPPLRTLQILNRQTHGWTEFAEPQSCISVEAVHRFYQRQGSLLALLNVLDATDFHYENLIASGEHPVVIDMEALFHPHFEIQENQVFNLHAFNLLYNHSVLRVGLLPNRIWVKDDQSEGIDISGIGGIAGQVTPFRVLQYENLGTDEMQLTRKSVELAGESNRPKLDGNDIDSYQYTHDVAAGFAQMYRLLMEHRDTLLSLDGMLTSFINDEVRIIVRETRSYAVRLLESSHPNLLRDAVQHDMFFEMMWDMALRQASFASLVPSEIANLQQTDIPLFTVQPNTRHIWDSMGGMIKNVLGKTSLSVVNQRIDKLNETHLEQQLWLIRASMATLNANSAEHVLRLHVTPQIQKPFSRDHCLTIAMDIGNQLLASSLSNDTIGVSWLNLTYVNERFWMIRPTGISLYDGITGIGMFLAYLDTLTPTTQYGQLAHQILDTVLFELTRTAPTSQSVILGLNVGAFEGIGSIIYYLTHTGVLWNRPDVLDAAETLAEKLPPLIEQDKVLDIIAGTAGCLLALLALYQIKKSPHLLEIAKLCGEHLINSAQPCEEGQAWLGVRAKPLGGFSHGAAGIAYALSQLAYFTEDQRFCEAALSGLAYERTLFSPEAMNWRDLRELPAYHGSDGSDYHMTFWCHGASGIGLGRLGMLKYIDSPDIRQDIQIAIEKTLKTGFGDNHSLCHGDFGNLELLIQGAEVLGETSLSQDLEQTAIKILATIEASGLVCPIPQGLKTPGLMIGIAGIGYGLLRLVDPQRIPSILMLEPPR